VNDTSERMARLIAERCRQMTPQEREWIASGMFDSASLIIHSTLPADLSRRDRRLAWAKRFYQGELPEAVLIALAEWEPPGT